MYSYSKKKFVASFSFFFPLSLPGWKDACFDISVVLLRGKIKEEIEKKKKQKKKKKTEKKTDIITISAFSSYTFIT